VAELRPVTRVEPFEPPEQPPRFAFDLRVQTWRLPLTDGESARDSLCEFALLPCGESGGRALPEDEPFDLALDLLRERQSGRVDLAQLGHAPRIGRTAESGTHAEAGEVQPADLVRRRFRPPGRVLDQHVREPADDLEGPRRLAVA